MHVFDGFLNLATTRARRSWVLQRFTLLTRILLAMGFFPTGMVKVLGRPFTTAGTESPIGYFFDALYRTGGWWQFIGWAQVIPCVLLLIPRTSTLGALLFLPVMLNIVIITVTLQFTGTPAVTALMLLATFYLLIWDYDRISQACNALLGIESSPFPTGIRRPTLSRTTSLEIAAFWVLAICGIALFSAFRSLIPGETARFCLLGGTIGLFMLAVAWLTALRKWWRRNQAEPLA